MFHHLHFIDIVQQLSKGSDEWFWLQVSLEVADKMATRSEDLSEDLTGAGGSASKVAPSHKWKTDASC